MSEKFKSTNSASRILIPGFTFGIGALVSIIVGKYLLFQGVFPFIVSLVDGQQTFIQLLIAILLALLGLGLVGAIVGAIGGVGISKISSLQTKKQFIWKSSLSFFIPQIILIIPFILAASIISRYNAGFEQYPRSFSTIFGFFGIIYGLVAGLILGWTTMGFKKTYQVILTSILGFGIGGVILGAGIWRLLIPTTQGQEASNKSIVVMLLIVLFYSIGGIALGWYYSRSKASTASKKTKTSSKITGSILKYKRQILIAFTALIILSLFRNFSQIIDFITVRPASLATQLTLPTVATQWSPVQEASLLETSQISKKLSDLNNNPQGDQINCQKQGIEISENPTCIGIIQTATDSAGQTHAIWLSQGLEGHETQDFYILESILDSDGIWSEAMMLSPATQNSQPILTKARDSLVVAWETQGKYFSRTYTPYTCSPNELGRLGKVIYDSILQGEFWSDQTLPICDNQYQDLVYMPNPQPEYSDQPDTPDGGFNHVSLIAQNTKYELQFVNMEWQKDQNIDNPGSVLARSIVQLHKQLQENPQDYPRGINVKILLGNYPVVSDFEWGTQIWHVYEDLKHAGLTELHNQDLGWNIEVANYEGTWPHAHTKFFVIDGQHMMAAGFNYGYLHFPTTHSSGSGYDLEDLGILISGPIAQAGMAVFDDMWDGANQVVCENFSNQPDWLWQTSCDQVKATVQHVPEVLRYYIPENADSHAFSLYRNEVFKEADTAIEDLLRSSEKSIDLFEVNYTMKIYCTLSVLFPDICDYDDRMVYMDAVMDAVETNGVKVRILVERSNMNGIDNLIAAKIFQAELASRGLADLVEIKFFEGKMHDKAVLVDDELLIVGSQNFQYSAWGESGLVEYSLASDDSKAIEDFQKLYQYHWDRGDYVEDRSQLTSSP